MTCHSPNAPRPSAWKFAVTVCAALATGAGRAEASFILYDSTPGGNFGTFGFVSDQPYMESFSTGANPVNLTSVTVAFNRYGNDTGITTATLLADAGGTPGAVLTTIGTSSATIDPSTYTPASPYLLAANTRYWVEISEPVQPGGAGVGWAWTYLLGATTGVSGEYAYFKGKVYLTSSFGAYLMTVRGDEPSPPVSSTPAPSGLLLFGSAVPVLALVQTWRRNRPSTAAG